METFAYIHAAVSYEDPNPAPELSLELQIPSSAWMGLAGAAVVVSLISSSPEKAAAATTPVSFGSSGAEVQAVQKALGIAADGQYGSKTEAAVTDFQIRQGLKQIDGVVGQETAKAMGLDEKYKPTGYVDTASGVGVNIRTGPGLDYRRIGGAYDGAYLDEIDEDVVFTDGYAWRPLDDGGWVATNYTYGNEGPDYYYDFYETPVSYDNGYYDNGYYDEGSEVEVSYSEEGGYVDTYYGVGLNRRTGPGLDYARRGGYYEGAYVPTDGDVVYADGYAWQQTDDGGWVATNYLD